MEYEWDWGRFPQPSPMRERFQFRELFPRTSTPPATIEEVTPADSLASSTADEVVFGLGGLLRPDPKDPYLIILALDQKTMTFQLSLCGCLDGIDEVEDERLFESQRVSWRKFVAKKQIVKHEDLVIRWDDKYVNLSCSSRDSHSDAIDMYLGETHPLYLVPWYTGETTLFRLKVTLQMENHFHPEMSCRTKKMSYPAYNRDDRHGHGGLDEGGPTNND
jgi:hypothetical protein